MTYEQFLMLLDKGVVVALFVVTFILALWKWAPYIINKVVGLIESMQSEHTAQIKLLTKTFEEAMEKFIKQASVQHNEQLRRHEEHRAEFKEIKMGLDAIAVKYQSIKK